MNFKLIGLLSLFGLAMAVATVYVIPSTIEPPIWLAIFVFCAWVIARRAPGKYFLHGLCVGLANCVWITAVHIALFDAFALHHQAEIALGANGPVPPRAMMALIGPVFGVASGVVLGLFCLGARKIAQRMAKAQRSADSDQSVGK